MTFDIRNAEESDFPEIVKLFQEFATFQKVPEKMTNTVDQMIKEKELFNGFVAENNEGKLVGYVTYFFSYHTWVGKSLYMDDLYVKPEYRGNGIGKELIQKVIKFARESSCYKLRWQVSYWNEPAIEFYKSLGAEIESSEYNCDLVLR